VAVDLRSAVNFPQLLATAIERENVPICVPAQGDSFIAQRRKLRTDCGPADASARRTPFHGLRDCFHGKPTFDLLHKTLGSLFRRQVELPTEPPQSGTRYLN